MDKRIRNVTLRLSKSLSRKIKSLPGPGARLPRNVARTLIAVVAIFLAVLLAKEAETITGAQAIETWNRDNRPDSRLTDLLLGRYGFWPVKNENVLTIFQKIFTRSLVATDPQETSYGFWANQGGTWLVLLDEQRARLYTRYSKEQIAREIRLAKGRMSKTKMLLGEKLPADFHYLEHTPDWIGHNRILKWLSDLAPLQKIKKQGWMDHRELRY